MPSLQVNDASDVLSQQLATEKPAAQFPTDVVAGRQARIEKRRRLFAEIDRQSEGHIFQQPCDIVEIVHLCREERC